MARDMKVYEKFMKALVEERIPVVVFLVNGVKLQGIVEDFDDVSVILKRDINSQILYRHSLSTIVPQRETGAV